MDSDWMIVGIVLSAIVYLSGYRTIGVLVGLLLFMVFSVSVLVSGSGAKSGASSGILEPIIIESTRGNPYRIPEKMNIQYDPGATGGFRWEKTVSGAGKSIGKIAKKAKGEK